MGTSRRSPLITEADHMNVQGKLLGRGGVSQCSQSSFTGGGGIHHPWSYWLNVDSTKRHRQTPKTVKRARFTAHFYSEERTRSCSANEECCSEQQQECG